MVKLAWKVRISVLWVFMAMAMLAHSVLFFMEPGAIEQIMSGEIEGVAMGPMMFLFMALLWWVPLVMAFLSVALKDSANRRTNIILGIVFTVLNVGHLIEHILNPSAHQLLIIGSTVVATALIVWHAFKWPKQEAES